MVSESSDSCYLRPMNAKNSARGRFRTTALRGPALVGLAAAVLLSACKASPCSDDNLDLPPHLAELPLLDEEASVCIVTTPEPQQETAMIMRWGDEISPLQTKLMAEMDAAGWAQRGCGPEGFDMPTNPDEVCFEKGEQYLSASFELGDSKQLGIERPAIITHVRWGGG